MFVDDDRLRRLQGVTRSAGETTRAGTGALPGSIGRYEVRSLLGRGGMGVVYLAWDAELRREVAVKVLRAADRSDEEQIARFWREARIAGNLNHPGIVAVHEVGAFEDSPFVVMERIDGESLSRVIEERDAWPLEERVRVVRDAARAIEHAHGHGIVHRDLKPSNLLVDRAGRVRVLDFGLARRMEGETRLTGSDQVLGTPGYMPPEQASPQDAAPSPTADVFALGAILYEVLTRRRAVSGSTLAELMRSTLAFDVTPPRAIDPRIPRPLELVCLRCLEPSPAARYRDARGLADDLDRWLAGDAVLARPPAAWIRALRAASRRRAVLISIAALGLTAAALTGWGAWERANRAAAQADLDRRRADAEAARARADLETARLVSDVLGRWAVLSGPLGLLEDSFHDSRLSPVALRTVAEAPWTAVRRFLEETPADPASQAVARALAGWARRLAGHEDEGLAWMREARERDPNLPFGAALEALVLSSRYLEAQQLPPVYISGAGLRILGTPEETPAMAGIRADIERHLAQAGRARVWGGGIAAELRALLEAFGHLQAARYAQAEQRLSDLLGRAPHFRSEILLARAHARSLDRRYHRAVEDYEAVRAARPHHAPVLRLLASSLFHLGVQEDLRGRDARPRFRAALAHLDRALELDPDLAAARANRAQARFHLGLSDWRAGSSPQSHFDAALADFDADVEEWPEEALPFAGRAMILDAFGDWAWEAGHDARDLYRRAAEALEEAARRGLPEPQLFAGRGGVAVGRGLAEGRGGGDPRPHLEAALTWFDRLLEQRPDEVEAWHLRAKAGYHLGDALEERGQDPVATLERAIADFTRALERDPAFAESWGDRGNARLRLGEVLHARHQDPRPLYRLALSDQEEGMRLRPEDPHHRFNHGAVWLRIAEAELALRGDPREACARAVDDFDAVLKLAPHHPKALAQRGDARTLWGQELLARRQDPWPLWDRAIADYREARTRKSAPWNSLICLGQLLEGQAAYGEAAGAYREALTLPHPDPGQIRDRIARVQEKIDRAGPGPLAWWWILAHRAGEALQRGEWESARLQYESALEEAGAPPPDERPDARAARVRAHYNLACLYALSSAPPNPKEPPGSTAQRRDDAFRHLDRAVTLGWSDLAHLKQDPDLRSLHHDPRWSALLERLAR